MKRILGPLVILVALLPLLTLGSGSSQAKNVIQSEVAQLGCPDEKSHWIFVDVDTGEITSNYICRFGVGAAPTLSAYYGCKEGRTDCRLVKDYTDRRAINVSELQSGEVWVKQVTQDGPTTSWIRIPPAGWRTTWNPDYFVDLPHPGFTDGALEAQIGHGAPGLFLSIWSTDPTDMYPVKWQTLYGAQFGPNGVTALPSGNYEINMTVAWRFPQSHGIGYYTGKTPMRIFLPDPNATVYLPLLRR